MKVYEKSNLTRESRRRNVQREVHVLGEVRHPNIVEFHEWFATDRHVYIVMEYVAGGSLQAMLRKQPLSRFDETTAKRLFHQVLQGVGYLHDKRIMHRDLKLENLLLDKNGVVKIIDFGFAVVLPPAQKLKIFCGTPSYIAPEIIQGHMYSFPGDVWALGVLLHVLLSGRFPFKASSQRELYRRILRCACQVPDSFSSEAKALVEACLQKDQAPRPTVEAMMRSAFFTGVSTTSSGSSLGFAASDATATTAATDERWAPRKR